MNRTRTILIKGAGEKASAVAHGLSTNGFKRIMMTDISYPLAERRGVCFSEAAIEYHKDVIISVQPDQVVLNLNPFFYTLGAIFHQCQKLVRIFYRLECRK